MRLNMEEVQKQHESTKKLYEQGLTVAPVDVKRVLDLYDTIEALQQENNDWQELYYELYAGHSRLFKDFCKLQQENEQLRAQIGEVEDKGKISDGYHTFNELYYHRMILFSVICNHHKDIAWKSWKHADGTMFDDYFIVGITTPKGDYTYHYQKQYWNIFDVKELEFAPEWDGHQPKDIDRLLSIIPDTDYHNPADVEALIKSREALEQTKGFIKGIGCYCNYEGEYASQCQPCFIVEQINKALAVTDKAIGGKEDV